MSDITVHAIPAPNNSIRLQVWTDQTVQTGMIFSAYLTIENATDLIRALQSAIERIPPVMSCADLGVGAVT